MVYVPGGIYKNQNQEQENIIKANWNKLHNITKWNVYKYLYLILLMPFEFCLNVPFYIVVLIYFISYLMHFNA